MAWMPIAGADALPRNVIKGSASGANGVAALLENPQTIYNDSLRILLDANPIGSEVVLASAGVVTLLSPSVFRTSSDYIGTIVYRAWIRYGEVVWTIRDTSGTIVDIQTQTNNATEAEEYDAVGAVLLPDTVYTAEATFEALSALGATCHFLQIVEA